MFEKPITFIETLKYTYEAILPLIKEDCNW